LINLLEANNQYLSFIDEDSTANRSIADLPSDSRTSSSQRKSKHHHSKSHHHRHRHRNAADNNSDEYIITKLDDDDDEYDNVAESAAQLVNQINRIDKERLTKNQSYEKPRSKKYKTKSSKPPLSDKQLECFDTSIHGMVKDMTTFKWPDLNESELSRAMNDYNVNLTASEVTTTNDTTVETINVVEKADTYTTTTSAMASLNDTLTSTATKGLNATTTDQPTDNSQSVLMVDEDHRVDESINDDAKKV
jgi:hypothetical protein